MQKCPLGQGDIGAFAGTRPESARAAMELCITNLNRLHIYALGVAEDADSREMDVVSADDIELLQSLIDALENMKEPDT